MSLAINGLTISNTDFNENKKIQEDEIKEFTKKLSRIDYFTIRDNNRAASQELDKIIPKWMDPQQVVDAIFKLKSTLEIKYLLDGFNISYPSYEMCPYDKIRKAILDDTKHTLNNNSLIALFKEHNLNEEDQQRIYDWAYENKHPYLYQQSSITVSPNEYNLNFVWVNLNPQDRIENIAQNIFKDGLSLSENDSRILDPKAIRELEANEASLKGKELNEWNAIKKSFTYKLSKWADVNPGAEINLWYDSALITQNAQQKTFEMMQGISQSRDVNIKLKDLRKLSRVEGEIENIFHPAAQVYYRVDLLKALIVDKMLENSPETPSSYKYCVVSDIDVEAMSSNDLFDERTLNFLKVNGYVFNRNGMLNFENSFFIFNKEKKDIKDVHYETIIKESVNKLSHLRIYPYDTNFRCGALASAGSVCGNYHQFQSSMNENYLLAPRKVVDCPPSQFNFGGNFSKSDYQSETFRFIGEDKMPYTQNGRNYPAYWEKKINALIDWKAEPLDSI